MDILINFCLTCLTCAIVIGVQAVAVKMTRIK